MLTLTSSANFSNVYTHCQTSIDSMAIDSRAGEKYIVVSIYCTIYFIVQYNKICCKAKYYIVYLLL